MVRARFARSAACPRVGNSSGCGESGKLMRRACALDRASTASKSALRERLERSSNRLMSLSIHSSMNSPTAAVSCRWSSVAWLATPQTRRAIGRNHWPDGPALLALALTARSSEVALLSLGVITPALKRIVRSQAERIRDTHSSTFLNVVLLKSPACSCALSRPTSIAARSSS